MNLSERRTVGSAIQRGLMHVTGYFDDWGPEGGYPPDWAVTAICEHRGQTFVYGFNLNCAPGEYGHCFSWRFSPGEKALKSWRYRFELCPGAEGSLS